MFIYRWGFIGFIIAVFLLSGCNSPNNSDSNNRKSENAATAGSGIEEDLGIQSISSTSSPTPALEESNAGINLPNVNPLKLGGELRIGGSTIMYFVTQAIAERFIEEGYPGKIEVTSAGTGKGFQLFCSEGKLDILNAYRPINAQEVQACNQAGREPISFQIATDALAIVVSRKNDFLPNNLSREDIRKIFTAEKWSDVNKDWPDRAIRRNVANLFVKTIFGGNAQSVLKAPNTKIYNFEEELIQDALINQDVIGLIGYTYYMRNKNAFSVISIDGIPPSSFQNYPFTSPMFIYADAEQIRTRPEIKGFINFYLQNIDEEVENAGSLPPEETALNTSKLKLLNVLGRAK